MINCREYAYEQIYIPVIRAILVVIHQLEAINVIHKLNSDVVADENHVISRRSVSAKVGLGGLRDTGIPHKRRPYKAMNSLVPQDSAESRIVKAGEKANYGLIVVLPDFLGDETSFMLVVNSQPSIHVYLVNKR